MGYTTEFSGTFRVEPFMAYKHLFELNDLCKTRHSYDSHPSIWCGWEMADDHILRWNGKEKFYKYIEWLKYIVDVHLEPNGYSLNGEVIWFGDKRDDSGIITVKNNEITTEKFDVRNPDTYRRKIS